MAFSVNSVTFGGYVVRNPVFRQVGKGSVANVSIASNRSYKNSEGMKVEDPTFMDVECWNAIGELVAQYVTKGSRLLVQGRLKLDQWQDSKTNEKRSRVKIVAETVHLISNSEKGEPTAVPLQGREVEVEEEAPIPQAPRPGSGRAVRPPPRALAMDPDDEPPF